MCQAQSECRVGGVCVLEGWRCSVWGSDGGDVLTEWMVVLLAVRHDCGCFFDKGASLTFSLSENALHNIL